MTTQKTFKRRVRARMAKTRESYTAARRKLVDARPAVEKVVAATGRTWDSWFGLLDAWDAAARTHTETARWLRELHAVPSWWSQSITVAYEQARGLRVPGQQVSGGFTGARAPHGDGRRRIVEQVPAHLVPVGDRRVVEVLVRIARHADPLHHRPRALVRRRRERHQLVELEVGEREGRGGARRLAGVAVAPGAAGEPPAELHRGREVGIEADRLQARVADELAAGLERPQAPAALVEARLDLVDERVALLARHRRREMPHHLGIGVQRSERRPVGLLPAPHQKSLGPHHVTP